MEIEIRKTTVITTPAPTEEGVANDQPKSTPSHGATTQSYNRELKVDEASYDPLTIARMTDHNVRGVDDDEGYGQRATDDRFKDMKK